MYVNYKKIVVSLIIINSMQFAFAILICMKAMKEFQLFMESGILLSLSLMLFSTFLTIVGLFFVVRYKNRNLEESMKNLELLNNRLREQRHDYLNHVQVIYGLVQLEAYEDADAYMGSILKEIQKLGKALKTTKPAVNALLQAKLETAEREGIDLFIEVYATLECLKMEPWDLCRILGNLIDNAFSAVGVIEGEKKVWLEIREDQTSYTFCVSNNGPAIPHELQSIIFQEGVSTKQEEGHGMGLAIVSQILHRENGKIELQSEENKTSFSIVLSKMTV